MSHAAFDATRAHFADLLASCPVVAGATVSKPMVNLPQGKVIVFAMDAGQEMSEHRAPYVATVHVLDGRLRFGVSGEERVLGPHEWVAMPADAPHRLTALAPTRFLLTLFKSAASG